MTDEQANLFSDDVGRNPVSHFVVGKVAATFFSSSDSFYKVLLVKVTEQNIDWSEDEIVVTGNFADIQEETTYRFTGRTVTHPKYGVQFQADNYQNETPTTRSGLIAYLSGMIFLAWVNERRSASWIRWVKMRSIRFWPILRCSSRLDYAPASRRP